MDMHEQEMSNIANNPTIDPELRKMAMEVLWKSSELKSRDDRSQVPYYQKTIFGSHISSSGTNGMDYILTFSVGVVIFSIGMIISLLLSY